MMIIKKYDEKGPIIDVFSYKKLKYSKNPNARYSNLHDAAMKLIEVVENNKVLYKKKIVQLSSMLESTTCNDDSENLSQNNNNLYLQYPLPQKITKESKERRGIMASQVSHLRVSVPKKRSMDTCSTCEIRDPINIKGHSNGSSCPYYKKYCDIC